ARTWKLLSSHRLTEPLIYSEGLTFSPDGRQLVSARMGDLTVWQTPRGAERPVARSLPSVTLSQVVFFPDGKRIAGGRWLSGGCGVVTIHDQTLGPVKRSFKAHPDGIDCLAVRPDGRQVASAGRDKVKMWDPDRPEVVRTLEGVKGRVDTIVISPDGRRAM